MKELFEGIALGLATGAYCLAGCVPLLLPFYFFEKRDWRKSARILVEFLVGRLIAYALVGALAGTAGEYGRDALGREAGAVMLLVAGGLLLAGGVVRLFPEARFCQALGRHSILKRLPFAAGFLLGINLCPPFVAGVAAAVSYASTYRAVVFFLGFFAGSTVYLLPVVLASGLTVSRRIQDTARIFGVLAGLYFLARGVASLVFQA